MESITGSSSVGYPAAREGPPAAASGTADKPVIIGAIAAGSLVGLALIVTVILIVVLTRRWNSQAREKSKKFREKLMAMEEAAAERQKQASLTSETDTRTVPASTNPTRTDDLTATGPTRTEPISTGPTRTDLTSTGPTSTAPTSTDYEGSKTSKLRSQPPVSSKTSAATTTTSTGTTATTTTPRSSAKSHTVKTVGQQVKMNAQTSNVGAPPTVKSTKISDSRSVSENAPPVSITTVGDGDKSMTSVKSQSVSLIRSTGDL